MILSQRTSFCLAMSRIEPHYGFVLDQVLWISRFSRFPQGVLDAVLFSGNMAPGISVTILESSSTTPPSCSYIHHPADRPRWSWQYWMVLIVPWLCTLVMNQPNDVGFLLASSLLMHRIWKLNDVSVK